MQQLHPPILFGGEREPALQLTAELSDGWVGGRPVPDLDTLKRFEDAGVHRLVVFVPGFVPRSRFAMELFPQIDQFATEVMAKV